MTSIVVHPEVAGALRAGRAVVALESAVITTGLPRTPAPDLLGVEPDGWAAGGAVNLETARAMCRAVREGGAVPATVAVLDGALRVGLEADDLARLARDERAGKAAARDLAAALTSGRAAGTTVSATLAACGALGEPPIRVLATGGIGGVHRGWAAHPDVSGDLAALAATRACVVCSGAKTLLDLPATAEALEALGVPVVAWRSEGIARFTAPPDPSLPATCRLDDAASVARLCRVHWDGLGRPGAVLLSSPVPARSAVPIEVMDEAVEAAERDAAAREHVGAMRTPAVLAAVAEATEGRARAANVDLLVHNARLASAVAVALAEAPSTGGSRRAPAS